MVESRIQAAIAVIAGDAEIRIFIFIVVNIANHNDSAIGIKGYSICSYREAQEISSYLASVAKAIIKAAIIVVAYKGEIRPLDIIKIAADDSVPDDDDAPIRLKHHVGCQIYMIEEIGSQLTTCAESRI